MARKDEHLARGARVRVERWQQYFKYNIDQYHEMHQFVLSRQWELEEEDMLKSFKKVPLQFNKLATLCNTLLGEQQQNTPQIEVVPMENCDEETAQIRELITKDIMFCNDTKNVYQVAASQAIVGGFGAYFIDTQYAHSKSFDQDIVYRSFKDSTLCYWDMSAEKISKIDGMFAGFVTRLSRNKFRSIYGREVEEKILNESSITQSEQEIALATDVSLKDYPFNWADSEGITVIDDFVRKFVNKKLYKMSNGKILTQDEIDELIERSKEINKQLEEQGGEEQEGEQEVVEKNRMTLWDDGEPVRIVDKRTFKRSIIMRYKIAGEYVLDESEFPAEDLPVIFMDQHSFYDKDGKQVCRPFIIDAIDAQRYLNYLGTQAAYILKISRYDQFIGSKKNVQGLDTQRDWRDPENVKGLLAYDESPSGAKPEQLRPPELSQSLLTQYQRAIDDMYTSTGLYPSRLGQAGGEISGAAIDARTRQGSYPTYVVFNSINRAITSGGEVLNQMIPLVYDAERVISLMTPDGQKNITVNKEADDYGIKIENDIRKGTYQIRLRAGPSYEGQKERALESLNMVLQANPQLLNLFADLYADNLPLANTIEIKNRLKTIVPPEIIQAGKTGKMPNEMGQNKPSPEEQQLQLQQQQAQAEMQFKQQELQIKQQELQLKAQQQKIDLEIEMQKLQAEKIEVAGQIEEQKLRYQAETMRTESDTAVAHANNLVKILTSKVHQ